MWPPCVRRILPVMGVAESCLCWGVAGIASWWQFLSYSKRKLFWRNVSFSLFFNVENMHVNVVNGEGSQEPKQRDIAGFLLAVAERTFCSRLKSHTDSRWKSGKVMILCSTQISPFCYLEKPGLTEGSVTSVFFFCENLQWWEAELLGVASCHHLLVRHTLTQSVSLSEYSFSESTYFIEYLWGFSKIVDRELQCSFKAYSKWSIYICRD